jgi:hypothetical protein
MRPRSGRVQPGPWINRHDHGGPEAELPCAAHARALSEASIRSEEGELLAHGTSTLMLLKNAPMKADLPAKFLD